MGSSCSSRQSSKDSVSVKSEDSDNEQEENGEGKGKKEETINSGVDKVKLRDKSGLKLIESDFSSCCDEGAGVGTPLSSTVSAACATDAAIRGKPPDKSEIKKEDELPNLSLLNEETKLLLEGKFLSKDLIKKGNKINIIILGQLEGNEKYTKELTNGLRKNLSEELDENQIEVVSVNLYGSVPLYRYSLSPSQLLLQYMKENDGGSNFVLLFLIQGSSESELYEVPASIQEEEYQTLCENLMEAEERELVQKWYQADPHRKAFRRLQSPVSVFQGLSSSETSEYNKAYESWSSEYNKLLSLLLKSSKEEKSKFRLVPTVEKGIELVKDYGGEIPAKIMLVKTCTKKEEKEKVDQFFDTLEMKSERVSVISPKISSEGGTELWRDEFEKDIKSSISQFIQSNLQPHQNNDLNRIVGGMKNQLLLELIAHHSFTESSLREKYHGLDNYLNQIQTYLTNDVGKPLFISGEIGSGKSLLVSAASAKSHSWCPEAIIMTRYVGLTEKSTTVEGILHYLVDQTIVTHGSSSSYNCTDMKAALLNLWKKANSSRPIVIFIDGIDQFCNPDREVREFIDTFSDLPEHVKLVMSIRKGISYGKDFADHSVLTIENMNQDYENILREFMVRNNEHLSESLWTNLNFNSCSPSATILLLVLSHLLVTGNEPRNYGQSISEDFYSYFKILQSLFSTVVIETVLGCLALTNSGLLESEILALIESSQSSDGASSFCEWLYLRHVLKPILRTRRERGHALFCCASFAREAALKFFSEDEGKKINRCHTLAKVVDKYEDNKKVEQFFSEKKRLRQLRALQESFLIYECENKENEILFNINWLFQMVESSGPFKVIEKSNLALRKSAENEEVQIMKEVLQLSSYSLAYDSSQFFSQVYGRLKWRLATERNCPRLSSLLTSAAESPLPCLLPLSSCLASRHQTNSSETDKDNNTYISSIFRIPQNSHHVIAISTVKSQLTVWNIVSMEIVRTLNGINQPRNLEMIDDYKCLLLCGRELRIYDLNKGTFLMKLREVMNQKMPFYGLHDSDHVVALSRNRMYVNMMNLTQGNCVTTFKVGEDRFLNSLLVSENGKICVCGDDSQKPSALLVWNLELRKLMYDLRIPHHEFATRLAAITIEGHYVCCVCKEVNEPAPNFIVVYDLQSGTLFKRWKPDVNTLSITISTAGTCVIVGLEDSSVMAFDLITGNLRWTVYGHCSPPDTFRLDQKGLVLLSYDSQGKDRSLRVWDVQTGSSFATLTPDRKISACEITSDGKAVILAFEGQSLIFTFLLLHKEDPKTIINNPVTYGDDENKGKVADFSQT